jgi:hypothetical protein
VPPPQWTDKVPVLDPGDLANYGPGSPFGSKPPPPELLEQMKKWWEATQVPPRGAAAPGALNSMLLY